MTSDPPGGAQKRFSVLLVDDERAFLEATSAVLETEHHVSTATDALSALRLLKANEHHVVITDWQMPGMDGLELIESIVKLELPVSVMFLTGRPEDLAAHLDGAWRKTLGVAIVAKPASAEVLLDRVRLLGRLALMSSSVKKLKKRAG